MRSRWTSPAFIIGGWAFLGSLLTFEFYFNARASMAYADLGDIAISQFGRAAMWVAMAPFIAELRRRVPLNRWRGAGGVGFHLAMAFVVMATFYLGRVASYNVLWDAGKKEFWHWAFAGFYGRNIIDMGFYWGVIAFGHALDIQQRYKNEELKAAQLETRLIEIELNALRQQMHPHFLFNTLNTVAVLVREQRNEDAVQLLARLSSLLRMSLDQSGVQEVTLQQELDFLGRYIEIQQMRFSDRLTVNIDVPSEALRARIPNLLLQPLVENAILHGIAPKHGPGRIDLIARIDREMLTVDVTDDGAGLADGSLRAREGIGLSNTRERLSRIYGLRAQMVLRSEAGRGVSVHVRLPFRT